MQYGEGRIAIEKTISYDNRTKRFDIVVFDKHSNPFILIECKSTKIKLSTKTLFQAARYNIALKAPIICLSNGISHFVARIDFHNMAIDYLNDLPSNNETFDLLD